MTERVQVTGIGLCIRIEDRTKAGRTISITLQADKAKYVLMMPETVAAVLAEKLIGLNLPPSGLSQTVEIKSR